MKDLTQITPLERWLRKNNLNMQEFAEIIGCHRQTLRSVKQNKGIDELIARKIYFVTNAEVEPIIKNKGRQSTYEHSHTA